MLVKETVVINPVAIVRSQFFNNFGERRTNRQIFLRLIYPLKKIVKWLIRR